MLRVYWSLYCYSQLLLTISIIKLKSCHDTAIYISDTIFFTIFNIIGNKFHDIKSMQMK